MRNSNIPNISIAIPTESRLKTYTEFDDRSLIINQQDDLASNRNPNTLNFNQNTHINKWLACRDRISKKYIPQAEQDSTKTSSCYMVQFEEIGDIGYRKKMSSSNRDRDKQMLNKTGQAFYRKQQPTTKLYLKIVTNFLHPLDNTFLSRTLQPSIMQLESKSPLLHHIPDPNLALFFHSKYTSEQGYRIRLELSVIESAVSSLLEVVHTEEYVGYCDIDPFKGLKTRQRAGLYSDRNGVSLDTFVAYTVLVTDSFKILQKLLPPNCLCSSQQSISGLAGRKLPNNISTLHYPIEYTQLHSLRLDVTAIDIPDTLLTGKIKEAELYARLLYNMGDVGVLVREVRLEGIFHNGWEKFSETSIKIQDKMEIQKKDSKKPSAQVIKIKHFTTQELFNLPFIFLDEESVLLLQVTAKLQIKPKANSTIVYNLSMPLCYSYYIINKISMDDKVVRTLYAGDALAQGRADFASKKNQANGSRIQFFVNVQHANKMHLSKHMITHHSNKSNVNNQAQRILLEKQRMIRENRKLRQINRIKKIELNQEIPILDTTNFKENLYRNEIDRLRQQRKQKQEVLEYLRKKIKELAPDMDEDAHSQNYDDNDMNHQKVFANRAAAQSYYDSVFYKAALERNANNMVGSFMNLAPDSIQVHSFPLFENPQAARMYQSGQVPLEVIKTELLEKNYSYGFFINWISLLPVSQDRKLPRKFYFRTSLFTHDNIQSCLCTINESTGQIVVFQEEDKKETTTEIATQSGLKKKTQQPQKQANAAKNETKIKTNKISYIEIGPDPKMKNNENQFIQFISYLYHSELQVKIVDATSGIQFGEVFYKLKDCIRMRRNEVEIFRDNWVRKQGEARAKLRIQIKAIRKQAIHQAAQLRPTISKLQTLSMEPEARQLQRIAQFKKLKQQSSVSKIDRFINEQLTKQQMFVKVFRMKGQLIKVQVKNLKNITQTYQVALNDPDRSFLSNEELVVVNRLLHERICQTGWWKYLQAIDNKYLNVIIADDNNCFQLSPGQVGCILLYYYSQRKYEGNYEKDLALPALETGHLNHNSSSIDPTKLLKVYNHSRAIDLTLHNSYDRRLDCLYKIQILPQPDPCTINYRYIRKQHSKITVQIPYVGNQNFVVYIDDPTVISSLNEQEGSVSLDCVAGGEGLCRKFNVSVLSPFPENRMLGNYCFQFWGACQIGVEGKLWQAQDVLVDLHSSVCLKRGLQFVLVLVDDEKTILVRQKNPIKVNQKQAKTIIRLSIFPSTIGVSYHELNIISPVDLSVIFRYIIKMDIREPQITQKITLRIKLTDKMLEEPFGFKNDLARKQRYTIMTTHPHILWCQQETLEIEAKSQKKIKIVINAEQVVESEAVILSFLAEKSEVNYLFILELDNQL